MKKILSCLLSATLLLLLVVNAAWARSEFTLVGKIGMDGAGKIVSDIDSREIEDESLSLSFEGLCNLNRRISMGMGFELQEDQGYLGLPIVNGTLTSFNFTPIYGVIRCAVPLESRRVKMFCIGKIGVTDFDATTSLGSFDTRGGLYFGAGLGLLYRQAFLVELDYSVHNGAIKVLGDYYDVTYSKLTLACGFNFNL